MRGFLALVVAVATTAAFHAHAQSANAKAVDIVVPAQADPLEQYAAAQLKGYLERLFGLAPAMVAQPGEKSQCAFFLGVLKRDCQGIPGAEALPALSDQGFLLRRIAWRNGEAMVIVGGSPVATMWGVYDLVERYGVRYMTTGDVFPPTPQPFQIPQLDTAYEPVFKVRMWKAMGDFAFGMEGWGMADYRPFLDQLAKMKFNRIRVNAATWQPFLDIQVPGIQRQTCTLWYGTRFVVTEDMPGRRLFGDTKEFWNPDIPFPEEGTDKMIAAGVRHVQELIAYAHTRGLESNLVGGLTDYPKEYAPVVPDAQTVNQLGSLTVAPGPGAKPDNPQLANIAGIVLKSIVDSYPECDSYGFPTGTEWPSWVDLYEWAWQELDAKYRISEATSLQAVLDAASKRTAYTGGAERALLQVKGDLTGLCFLDRIRTSPDILPKTKKPNAKISFYEIAEELFPIVNRVLPKDSDLYIVLDYTPTRVLRRREVFATVPKQGVNTIMVLTLQDDGVGVPPQLTGGSLHEIVTDMRKNGLAGFCTRQWMMSDLDPALAYLAKASWDPATTPDVAYTDFARALCGEAGVAPMLEAFREIEAVTLGLEDHGLGIGFPHAGMIMGHWVPGSYPNEYVRDRDGYRRALAAVQRVPVPASEAGKAYVNYWVARLEFGIGFFDTIEAVKVAANAEQVAKDAKQAGDAQAYKAKAGEAVDLAAKAQATAFQAIDRFAGVVRNRADVGAVATMAEFIFRPIKAKAEALRAESDAAAKAAQ